ncbi:beta-ketoacyl-ACP synthase [Devosia sp.]|uniref:beta-ketoacyl-ACP synthase n=1 Tax=Devosia sp. TaxID=1871048 RepID=UPI002FCA9B81
MLKSDPNDPIVVTGMGVVSPLGVSTEVNWSRLVAGRSGVVYNDRFDIEAFGTRIAGLVPGKDSDTEGFDPLVAIDPKDIKKMDLFIQYGLVAAAEAIAQSGWEPRTEEEQNATATIIGSGVGGSPVMAKSAVLVAEKGPRRMSPFTVPSFLANLAAGWISIRYGFKGPIGAPVTACAASAQAIGDGMRLLLTGEAEIAIVGGAEGSVDPLSIGGFGAARALSTDFNEAPEKASRPFDGKRDGFVLSEGAAVMVIEKLSHARARGAKPLAILSGYGTSADAYHLTAGSPDGAGAQVAMRKAIDMSGLTSQDIDFVSAHSTSTPVGDAAEVAAIEAVFGGRGKTLALSALKSSTGHLLGAAGALAAVMAVKSIQNGMVPGTLNLEEPDASAAQFDLANTAKPKALKHVLVNAFGFGGVNASLVLSAVEG